MTDRHQTGTGPLPKLLTFHGPLTSSHRVAKSNNWSKQKASMTDGCQCHGFLLTSIVGKSGDCFETETTSLTSSHPVLYRSREVHEILGLATIFKYPILLCFSPHVGYSCCLTTVCHNKDGWRRPASFSRLGAGTATVRVVAELPRRLKKCARMVLLYYWSCFRSNAKVKVLVYVKTKLKLALSQWTTRLSDFFCLQSAMSCKVRHTKVTSVRPI